MGEFSRVLSLEYPSGEGSFCDGLCLSDLLSEFWGHKNVVLMTWRCLGGHDSQAFENVV